jgi:hypothetical protein
MKIITIEDKNPHYIDLQHKTLTKYLKNDFEYICYNNALFNFKNRGIINNICKELNIESVEVHPDSNSLFSTNNNWIGPSEAHCWPLLEIWNDYKYSDEKIVIINSDMFLTRCIDFEEIFDSKSMAFVPVYYNNKEFSAWSGILFLDPKNIPNKNDFDLSLGYSGGERVDTAGKTRDYFRNNKIDINYLEMWTVENYNEYELKVNLNGNVAFTLDRHDNTILYDKFFPYELDRENYQEYIYHNYNYILEKTESCNFPKSHYVVQFMKLYNQNIEDSFIFHMLGGSNYIGMSDAYMKQRFEATKRFLGDL